MSESYIRNVIEAALLAAGKPLQLPELGQLFDEHTRPKVDEIRGALDQLAAEYSSRGIELKETAAGFRIQVRREFSTEISRLWPERPVRYSRALLETLALIAYRQPITRAEIEGVRGVAVNPNIVKTLIERAWVRVVGHRDVPGRPELLSTTREFLDYFGLRSIEELPALSELKAMGDYNLQLELPNTDALDIEPKASAAESSGADEAASNAEGIADDVVEVAVAEVAADSEVISRPTAESDDSETSNPVISSESSGASEEVADEDADDDELSADGHGSRELVAAPRDVND